MEARLDAVPAEAVVAEVAAPEKTVLAGKRTFRLVANNRAVYLIEAVTGLSLWSYLQTLRPTGVKGREVPTSRFYPLLWGLTATERLQSGERHYMSDEDRQMGLLIPSSFVATLPTGAQWYHIVDVADRLLMEAWSDTKQVSSGN